MRLAGLSPGKLLVVGLLIGLGLWLQGLVGLLFLVVGTELALSRQPFAARPICWPALCVIAVGMLLVDPAVAFACGWLVEVSYHPAMAQTLTSRGTGSVQG